MTPEQKVLMNRLQICGFVLLETALYLDTHPDDQDALAYFKKYNDLEKQTTDEYIQKFGPISWRDTSGSARWNWVDGPWPWEKEEG